MIEFINDAAKFTIIDAHAHIGNYCACYLKPTDLAEGIELAVKLGISRMCVSHLTCITSDFEKGNEELVSALNEYPDHLLGYVYYNPNEPVRSIAQLEKYIHLKNIIGVKIHPRESDCSLDRNVYNPLWEIAEKLKFPILCHTWDTETQNRPVLFESVLSRHPELTILLGHAGGTFTGYEDGYSLVRKYPYVYMDVNGSIYSGKWIEDVVNEVRSDRILFSTDQVFNDPRVMLGRILLADISANIKELLLSKNMLEILKRAGKGIV